MIRITEESKNKFFSFALAFLVSFSCFLSNFNAILNLVGIYTQLDTAILFLSVFAVVLVGLFLVGMKSRKIELDSVLVVVVFVSLYIITYLAYPQNAVYMRSDLIFYTGNPILALFVFSLPAYLFARQLTDYAYLKKYLIIFSYISVISVLPVFFWAGESSAANYMVMSYNILFQTFFLAICKEKHSIFRYIVVFGGVFVMIFGGCRGSIVSFLGGVAIYMLFKKSSAIKKAVLIFALLFGAVLFLLFHEAILGGVATLLDSMGIESRTFEMIISQSFFDQSGRDGIRDTLYDNISIFGEGLYGDRVVADGNYAHNIILEIIIQFGAVIGIVILLLMFALLFNAVKKRESSEWFYVMALLPNGLFSLFFSSSYLAAVPCFYMLMALCVNALTSRKED